jgi:outer membrane protein TolC
MGFSPHYGQAMYVLIVAGLLLLGALAAPAQTATHQNTRRISLQECIDSALRNNLDVQIQQVSSEISRYDLSGAYGVYSPTLSFEARRDFVSQPGDFAPQKFNLDYPYELTTDKGITSLGGILPFGMSYDLSALAGQKSAITDFHSNPDDSAPYPWGVRDTNNYFAETLATARQHLLKDFWIDQNRLTLIVGRKNLQISQQALQFQIMRTVFATEVAYFDLASLREAIRVQERAVELKRQLVSEIHRRVQVGDLPGLDADQAETELENSRTALITAREQYTSQQNILKALLTDDFIQMADVEIEPADALLALPRTLIRSESFQKALKNRPDLVEARIQVEKSQALVGFRINQLFPALDLVGSYGGLGVSPNSSTAMSDAANFRDPIYSYGAVVSLPLSNIKERNSYRASKAQKQLAELELKKAEQAVLVQVADWVNRVDSRFAQVSSTRRARAFAEAALTTEQRKLENGLSTSFFVLQMQDLLTQAQSSELRALSDYNKALAQLAFAEGSTLEKHHLIIQTTVSEKAPDK